MGSLSCVLSLVVRSRRQRDKKHWCAIEIALFEFDLYCVFTYCTINCLLIPEIDKYIDSKLGGYIDLWSVLSTCQYKVGKSLERKSLEDKEGPGRI